MAELNIPDEAQIRAERAVAPYALSGPDTVTAVEAALEVAAPLIVAAELERISPELTSAVCRRRDERAIVGGTRGPDDVSGWTAP